MKIFVTGVNSQLGHDVMNEISKRGFGGLGSDKTEEYEGVQDTTPAAAMPYFALDITNKEVVEKVLEVYEPDVVIHCEEWSPEDMGEDEGIIDKLQAVNVEGTRNIASACKKINCKMIYISSVAVFDGQGTEPWKAECEEFHPVNAYGQSKLDGEKVVEEMLEKYYIVRTSWVYGAGGNNFANRVISEGIMRKMIYMVTDQFGTPTYTGDLARLLLDMGESEKYGVYHAANEGGYVSSFEYARELFQQAGLSHIKVAPISTDKVWISTAPKPLNSRLDTGKLKEAGFELLPDWKSGIAEYMKALEL